MVKQTGIGYPVELFYCEVLGVFAVYLAYEFVGSLDVLVGGQFIDGLSLVFVFQAVGHVDKG